MVMKLLSVYIRIILTVSLFCVFPAIASAQPEVNPLDYGLRKAKNGVETYYVLLKCHQDAVTKNCGVSYAGIKNLTIEIPKDAVSIPLTSYTDFSGVTMEVKNRRKDLELFKITRKMRPMKSIRGEDIDRGDFSAYTGLNKGEKMLIIEDENPWVANRKGYGYGAIRRDIVLVSEGKALNKPIIGYGTPSTKPKGRYCDVGEDKLVIKNLLFKRTSSSTCKTMLVDIRNYCNVAISNITTITPDDLNQSGDAIIRIRDCANVSLDDISIQGTYSHIRKAGYGLSMNNIYNLKVNRMYARAKWGVFGTNNMNTVLLRDCDINRFDIHCYGRDISSEKCKYSGLYNQFSSVYGTVSFYKCTFTDFTPVLMEPSYNAYSPYDIVFKDCTFNLTKRRNFIFTFSGLSNASNSRPELRKKCMPNIVMEDCNVNLAENIKTWYLVWTGKVDYKGTLDYASTVSLRNVKVKGSAAFRLGTEKIKTARHLNVFIDMHK